jgi:hypothetical protein
MHYELRHPGGLLLGSFDNRFVALTIALEVIDSTTPNLWLLTFSGEKQVREEAVTRRDPPPDHDTNR